MPYLQVADIGSTETHTHLLSQLIQAVHGKNCFGGQVQIFRLWTVDHKATKYIVLPQESGVE